MEESAQGSGASSAASRLELAERPARSSSMREGARRRRDAPRGAWLTDLRSPAYCNGENDAGSRILFACVRSVSAPPGGGHTPVSLALVRMAARSSRLLYAQTWMKPLA